MTALKHPLQPILKASDGVIRFKPNKLVRLLLNQLPGGLNRLQELAHGLVEDEDWEQLAMLIGYSVSGWGDLSYVDKKRVREADKIAEKLMEDREEEP